MRDICLKKSLILSLIAFGILFSVDHVAFATNLDQNQVVRIDRINRQSNNFYQYGSTFGLLSGLCLTPSRHLPLRQLGRCGLVCSVSIAFTQNVILPNIRNAKYIESERKLIEYNEILAERQNQDDKEYDQY